MKLKCIFNCDNWYKHHSQHEQGIGALQLFIKNKKNTKNYQKLSFKKLKKPRNSTKNSNKICFFDLQKNLS